MASAVAVRGLVLGAALLVLFPTVVGAQAELQMWLNPELGKQIPRADYRFTYYPDRKVDNQEAHLGLSEHRVSLFVPLFQDTANEWGFSAKTRFQDIDTRARFPEVGGRFPSELWDAGGTLSFRHKFDGGWIGGLALTAGSASDEPFSSIEFKPFETLTLEAQYFPLRNVRARATWQIFQPLRAYAGFDWDHDKYYRANRDDKDDQIFYYEKRLTAGVRFDLRHVGFEVYGGWAFDRFYFEGERYGDRHDNRIDVGDGPFIVGKVSVRF